MLPEKLREKAYLTIIRPGLEYASAITDPHTPSEIKTLNKVPRHAARFVTNNPRTRYTPETEQVSVSGHIERLKWPSLEERRKNTRCTLMFRVKHDLVSIPPEYRPDEHRRVLQCTARGDLPRDRRRGRGLVAHDMPIFPRTCRDWEQLPTQAKSATKLGGFKAALQPKHVRQTPGLILQPSSDICN